MKLNFSNNKKFLFLYFLSLIYSSTSEIIIKFERKFPPLTKENIMENLIENNIYMDMTLGTPEQKIPMIIKINEHSSYIAGSEAIGNFIKFNEKNSKSYITNQNESTYFSGFLFAYKSTDTFNINSKKYENFEFYLGIKESFSNPLQYSGILGLGMKINCYDGSQSSDIESFVEQLYRKHIINYPVYYIKYLSENKGEIIIGNYPHEINNDIYNEFNLRTVRSIYDSDCDGYWDFYFENVTFNGKKINYFPEFHFKFELEKGVIEVGNYFYDIVKDFFKNNKCNEKIIQNIEGKFYTFNCDKNFEYKNFPNITFYNSKLDLLFTLEYSDLFYNFEDKYYFLVIINYNPHSSTYWTMGQPFFEKYLTTFDLSITKEKVGFYFDINSQNNNSNNNLNQENAKPYKISLVISILIIIFLCFALYYIFIRLPRKKRANELLDDFEYIPGSKLI